MKAAYIESEASCDGQLEWKIRKSLAITNRGQNRGHFQKPQKNRTKVVEKP